MDSPQKITIVIADDHPMVREGLRSMLNAPGVTVIGEAATGKEAVQLVQRLHPDVTLMDIRMHDMDGIEAAKILTEERIAPVVLLSAHSQRELVKPNPVGSKMAIAQ